MENKSGIIKAVIKGNVAEVQEMIDFVLDANLMTPDEILNNHLIPGMEEVGKRFRANTMYVGEVILSSRAMHAGINRIKNYYPDNSLNKKGKVLIGTVAGDLHDIGKKIVVIFLRTAGYEVIDLGIDVSPEDFAVHVEKERPDVLGLSALLTTTTVWMAETIKLLKKEKLLKICKVIVGGDPVKPNFARQIGADGYGRDAPDAVRCVNRLLGYR